MQGYDFAAGVRSHRLCDGGGARRAAPELGVRVARMGLSEEMTICFEEVVQRPRGTEEEGGEAVAVEGEAFDARSGFYHVDFHLDEGGDVCDLLEDECGTVEVVEKWGEGDEGWEGVEREDVWQCGRGYQRGEEGAGDG